MELSKEELEAIGFKENFSPADEMNADRVYYTIPVLNGEFIYNVAHAPYKWYFRNRNGEGSNNNLLDITHLANVYTLLQCFQAKFNLAMF